MRVNTESNTCILAVAAGTKEPICMHKAEGGTQELLDHKTLSLTETSSVEKASTAAKHTTVTIRPRHSRQQCMNSFSGICSRATPEP